MPWIATVLPQTTQLQVPLYSLVRLPAVHLRPASGTVPATVIVTSVPVLTDACQPQRALGSGTGLTVQIYPNTFGVGHGAAGNQTIPYLSDVVPKGVGISDTLGFDSYFPGGLSLNYVPGQTRQVPGISVDVNNFNAVYNGHYQPLVSGTYTICAAADDVVNVFLSNATAFSCGGEMTFSPGSTACTCRQY